MAVFLVNRDFHVRVLISHKMLERLLPGGQFSSRLFLALQGTITSRQKDSLTAVLFVIFLVENLHN